MYADVAGLKDSGGVFVELINFFVTKQIFQRSKDVRFIVALTVSEILESCGGNFQSLVQIL